MGLFDNAKTVMIGNKEVQSIKVTSNNAVLYEKQAQDNYLLTLTSNKDILSYYDNESATLTATLTNNNVPVSGEKVVFSFPRDENYTSKSITANTETTVGRKYIINTTFPENYRSTTYLDSEHKVKIVTSPGDGATLFVNGISVSDDYSSNFSVEDGVISWTSGYYSSPHSYDCSGYDLSVIKSTINLNINDYGGHYRVDTDSNGQCSVTYNSQGIGDVRITAIYDNLDDYYDIEDCLYENDGSSVGSLEVDSDVSCTSNGSYLTITKSGSSEKYVKLPVSLSGDWIFETTIAQLGTSQDLAWIIDSSGQWGAIESDYNRARINLGTSIPYPLQVSANDTLKITYINGTISIYHNDSLLVSKTMSVSGKIGFYTLPKRIQYLKDIKLRRVKTNYLSLTSDKNAISSYNNESATLTATLMFDGVPKSGETITFKNGSTVLGTDVTDSNGEAEYICNSLNEDMVITAEGYGLSDNLLIEDCWITKLPEYSITTSSSVLSIGLDDIGDIHDKNFELSFYGKLTGWNGVISIGASSEYVPSPTNKSDYRLTIGFDGQGSTDKRYCAVRTTTTDEYYGSSVSKNQYYFFKLIKQGNDVSYYMDYTQFGTKTQSFWGNYNSFSIYSIMWNNGAITIKDLKLKIL